MYSLTALKEAAGGNPKNSNTVNISYDAKEYVKVLFYLLKKHTSKSATFGSTGGGQIGNANKAYNGGNNVSALSANATVTDANKEMMYDPTNDINNSMELKKMMGRSSSIKRSNSIKTYNVPKLPNLYEYHRNSSNRLTYLMKNPYVQWITSNSPIMSEYIQNYYDEEYLPTGESEYILLRKFIDFLKTTNTPETKETLNILHSGYVSGNGRNTLALAVDYFKDKRPDLFNEYVNNTISMDSGKLGVENMNNILTAGEVVSNEYNNIVSFLPASIKDKVIADSKSSGEFSLREDVISLMYLGSYVISRTNDAIMANTSTKSNKRMYIFLLLDPNNKDVISEQVKIAYSAIPESHQKAFNPLYVYSTYLNDEMKKELEKFNLSDSEVIHPKTIGSKDEFFMAYEIPELIINRLGGAYPFVVDEKSTNIKRNNPKNIKPKTINLESIVWPKSFDI
jgi:hypothetical protein